MMEKNSTILIVGHDDIIENSFFNVLCAKGYSKVFSSTSLGLNPAIQSSVYDFFSHDRPQYIFLASTRSGGIEANQKFPAEFIYHNLESQNNITYAAHKFGAKKLLYIGSSCMYPKTCAQPMKEDSLLTGPLEKTSEPYAIAKIAGFKLSESYRKQYGFQAITIIPATLYGPESDVDIKTAHVMGALIVKFAKAIQEGTKEVVVWGTGLPRREFLYIDDFIEACLFLMNEYNGEDVMNVGCGYDISIRELSEMIAEIVGFKGSIIFDRTKPDGVMQKLLDNSRMVRLGWKARTSLKEGIARTHQWYLKKFKTMEIKL